MKIARFRAGRQMGYGVVEGDRVHSIRGSIFWRFHKTGESYPINEVKLLAPCRPGKVLAVGLNYQSHIGEREAPAAPGIFFKVPSCIIGPGENIILPQGAGRVDYEGELVVVMKRRARNVSASEALEYVLGYTCGNDVSARDWQRDDLQWWRAKGSDSFGPIGPFIVTDLDPSNLELELRLNGESKQKSSTSLLMNGVPRIISFISSVLTLEPGDIIFTGTPGATERISPGDVVEVEISGIGVLRNPVVGE